MSTFYSKKDLLKKFISSVIYHNIDTISIDWCTCNGLVKSCNGLFGKKRTQDEFTVQISRLVRYDRDLIHERFKFSLALLSFN